MRRAAIRRSFVSLAAVSVAILAIPLCSSANATANPSSVPAATTTAFQVPVRYAAGCRSNLFMCLSPPPLTTVTPTATPGEPGMVTFAAEHPTSTWVNIFGCLDVSVNWRNLTTGAAGTTVLRQAADYTRPAPEDRCQYTPAPAVTGSGTIAAVADIGAYPPADGYQVLINPGLGTFPVP
ncbi:MULTISPECIES: hypothetical protein [unclassified Rhodococcus (in: high G+C Gram-positive bacteria)]|uniref:hypothetical protein n=1 Tax=unclassified Rhodococcus (in: high G+C Gram-positive bacteria) TaxID=192944 RepID=UPI00096AA543|nr:MULTISPECIES: hypothetical protein [unclassified Rhodococcus (in: high G+C Gram-positive bacteria)]